MFEKDQSLKMLTKNIPFSWIKEHFKNIRKRIFSSVAGLFILLMILTGFQNTLHSTNFFENYEKETKPQNMTNTVDDGSSDDKKKSKKTKVGETTEETDLIKENSAQILKKQLIDDLNDAMFPLHLPPEIKHVLAGIVASGVTFFDLLTVIPSAEYFTSCTNLPKYCPLPPTHDIFSRTIFHIFPIILSHFISKSTVIIGGGVNTFDWLYSMSKNCQTHSKQKLPYWIQSFGQSYKKSKSKKMWLGVQGSKFLILASGLILVATDTFLQGEEGIYYAYNAHGTKPVDQKYLFGYWKPAAVATYHLVKYITLYNVFKPNLRQLFGPWSQVKGVLKSNYEQCLEPHFRNTLNKIRNLSTKDLYELYLKVGPDPSTRNQLDLYLQNNDEQGITPNNFCLEADKAKRIRRLLTLGYDGSQPGCCGDPCSIGSTSFDFFLNVAASVGRTFRAYTLFEKYFDTSPVLAFSLAGGSVVTQYLFERFIWTRIGELLKTGLTPETTVWKPVKAGSMVAFGLAAQYFDFWAQFGIMSNVYSPHSFGELIKLGVAMPPVLQQVGMSILLSQGGVELTSNAAIRGANTARNIVHSVWNKLSMCLCGKENQFRPPNRSLLELHLQQSVLEAWRVLRDEYDRQLEELSTDEKNDNIHSLLNPDFKKRSIKNIIKS